MFVFHKNALLDYKICVLPTFSFPVQIPDFYSECLCKYFFLRKELKYVCNSIFDITNKICKRPAVHLETTYGLDFKTPKFPRHVTYSCYCLDEENPYMQKKLMYVIFWVIYAMFVDVVYLK